MPHGRLRPGPGHELNEDAPELDLHRFARLGGVKGDDAVLFQQVPAVGVFRGGPVDLLFRGARGPGGGCLQFLPRLGEIGEQALAQFLRRAETLRQQRVRFGLPTLLEEIAHGLRLFEIHIVRKGTRAAVEKNLRAALPARLPSVIRGEELCLGAGEDLAGKPVFQSARLAEACPEEADKDIPLLDGEVLEDDLLGEASAGLRVLPDKKTDGGSRGDRAGRGA